MCGITGIWNFTQGKIATSAIDRFTDSLAHRGPDGRGVWVEDDRSLALGHRRLAILDLSGDGKQPMTYSHGRYVITFNGEIFNFVEIRAELESKGYAFTSSSDTEVILASYAEWGARMLHRFNGMWAFAIYDRFEKTLFIARDRFGIKPFLYLLSSQQFAFASELKAFKYLEGYSPCIDYETSQVLLEDGFNVEGTERTLLAGVRRLQAGHYGLLKNGKLTIVRWWKTLDHLVEPPSTIGEQAEYFRELFYDAVRIRMRSDVPIGSCLSGGFDSSAVVCALAEIGREHADLRQAREWQQTFIATFPGSANDERESAEEVVRFTGVRGNFFPVTDSEALNNIETVLQAFDDVYIGMPTAIWLIYRAMRRARVVVSLDGHGADELMGGYVQPDFLYFHNAPSLLRSAFENIQLIKDYRSLVSHFEHLRIAGIFRSPLAAFLMNHPSLGGRILSNRSLLKKAKKAFRRPFLRSTRSKTDDDFTMVGSCDRLPDQWGFLNRRFYEMFHSTLLPTILRNFDRLSMAHGIEIRMPFMDWRLVSYIFSLPDASKIGAGFSKRVAREAMRDRMPEKIRSAKYKIGFNSPLPEWFNGPLREWMLNLVESERCQKHELIDGRRFASFVRTHTKQKSWNWQNCSNAWLTLHYLWFEGSFLAR